jgi:uncharacterized membrane protein
MSEPRSAALPLPADRSLEHERAIGRLVIGLTYLGVAALLVGAILMVVNGRSPSDTPQELDPGTFVPALLAWRPEPYLWIGLSIVLATPIARVIAAGIGFALTGERRMVLISVLILLVVALAIVTALASEA